MTRRKIVVAGAGVIGVAIALDLARREHDVTLIDGDSGDWENFGAAASLGAAGMLAPLTEAAAAPSHAHPRLLEVFLAGLDAWRDRSSAHVRFNGGIVLGDDHRARIAAMAERCGKAVSLMSKAQIENAFDFRIADDSAGYIAEEGIAAPIPQLRAWLAEFREYGGKLHFDIEADTIERKPWGKAVRCTGGEMFSADHVVFAPGAWARDSLIEIAPALAHIRPAKGQLAAVRMRGAVDVNVHASNFYLAARGGGETILGATMEFDRSDRRVEPDKIAPLRAAAESAAPGEVADEHRMWAGVRPMSPDWAPMIGRSGADGALIACGHSRNGWLLAPLTAHIIGAMIEEKALHPLWEAFAPSRFG